MCVFKQNEKRQPYSTYYLSSPKSVAVSLFPIFSAACPWCYGKQFSQKLNRFILCEAHSFECHATVNGYTCFSFVFPFSLEIEMNNSYEHGTKQTTHNRNRLLSLPFFSFFQLLFCNADLARAQKDDNDDDDDDDDAAKHRTVIHKWIHRASYKRRRRWATSSDTTPHIELNTF